MQPDGTLPSSSNASNLLVPNLSKLPFLFDSSSAVPSAAPDLTLKIRIPPQNHIDSAMVPGLRNRTSRRGQPLPDAIPPAADYGSGSEYHESNPSMEADNTFEADEDDLPAPTPKVVYSTSSRGRTIQTQSYQESSDNSDQDELDIIDQSNDPPAPAAEDEGQDEDGQRRYQTRSGGKSNGAARGVVLSDSDGEAKVKVGARTRSGRVPPASSSNGRTRQPRRSKNARTSTVPRVTRRTRSNAHDPEDDGNYEEDSDGSADADGSVDDGIPSSPDHDVDEDDDPDTIAVHDKHGDGDVEMIEDGRPYALRARAKINYAIPPPLEDMPAPPRGRAGGRANGHGGNKRKGPGWSATGAELNKWMGAGDDSVSLTQFRLARRCLLSLKGFGSCHSDTSQRLRLEWRWHVCRGCGQPWRLRVPF